MARQGLKIVLDDITEKFVRTLAERIENQEKDVLTFATKHGFFPMKLWDIINKRDLPSYEDLVKLAEILNYDLSESFNYRYYNNLIDIEGMRAEIAKRGMTLQDMNKAIGASCSASQALCPNIKKRSMAALHKIEKYLKQTRTKKGTR